MSVRSPVVLASAPSGNVALVSSAAPAGSPHEARGASPAEQPSLRFSERALSLTTSSIFRGSFALMVSVLITAAGNAVFWAVAAHVARQDDVGVVAALSTAVIFVMCLTAMGLIPVVARYGSDGGRADRVVLNLSLIGSMTAAVIGAGLVCLVAVVTGLDQLRPIAGPKGTVVFVLVAAGSACTLLIEIRLLSRARYVWLIGRAALVGVVGVALLLFGLTGTPLQLFIASTGPTAVGGPLTWYFSERGQPDRLAVRPLPPAGATILRYARVSWVATVAGRAPWMGLPILVALLVTPSENAQFFLAWSIALVMFLVVQSVATALLAGGGRGTSSLQVQTRHALLLGGALAASIVIAIAVGAPLVRVVYGENYAQSVGALRILAISALPLAIYGVATATAYIRELSKVILALPLALASSVLLLAGALIPSWSIGGAATAWLIGTVIGAAAGAAVLLRLRGAPYPAA